MDAQKLTPQELCNAIYCAVRKADNPLTRREICKTIGKQKSPHILNMIEELTKGGWILKTTGTDKHGRTAFFYTLGRDVEGAEACKDT